MKVLVAMSGGVDSSVAAALLLEQGHEVVGVTMRLWGGDSDTGCCSVSDVDDARRVAQQLGIDHLVFNFTEDFHRNVGCTSSQLVGVGCAHHCCDQFAGQRCINSWCYRRNRRITAHHCFASALPPLFSTLAGVGAIGPRHSRSCRTCRNCDVYAQRGHQYRH